MGRDHPRIRGEHRGVKQYASKKAGSSPHTRGALHQRRGTPDESGIIPAYAGSTPGGHFHVLWRRGSSPHTRGALSALRRARLRRRIIPAYAGSTPPEGPVRGCQSDHPRIRGEHPGRSSRADIVAGSSPHTRGARPPEPSPSRRRRIIPAYAGSTLGSFLSFRSASGSSPHTRGAP